MTRKIIPLLVVPLSFFMALSLAACGPAKKPARVEKKPPLLLVTVCSLRQDHLGCYGYQRRTSPSIDRLASQASLFTRCYTPVPWTKPSTIALLTGRYPSAAGEDTAAPTLPEWLRARGYRTRGIVGTNVVRDAAKMNRGFDVYWDPQDLPTSKDPHTVSADMIVDRALEILRQPSSPEEPLFLWLFFKDPHWPYLPPVSLRERFVHDAAFALDKDDLRINADPHDSLDGIGEARLKDASGALITRKAYYIAQYDAEILFLDAQIGRLFEFLRVSGRFDDWLIVLVADHGESLGEGAYYFDHGYRLSEGLIRLPLIVKAPGQKKGDLRRGLVSLEDIFPMIASFLGERLAGEGYHGKRSGLFLENSPGHEENVKLLGCVEGRSKLVWDLSEGVKAFYSLEGQAERLVDVKRARAGKRIEALAKKIMSFFPGSAFYSGSDTEELKSLGYLQ